MGGYEATFPHNTLVVSDGGILSAMLHPQGGYVELFPYIHQLARMSVTA